VTSEKFGTCSHHIAAPDSGNAMQVGGSAERIMAATDGSMTTTNAGVPSNISPLETQRHPLETSDLTVNDYVCFPDTLQETKKARASVICKFCEWIVFVLIFSISRSLSFFHATKTQPTSRPPCVTKAKILSFA
jgi:hypothetical protein